jgi:hypothetical protein
MEDGCEKIFKVPNFPHQAPYSLTTTVHAAGRDYTIPGNLLHTMTADVAQPDFSSANGLNVVATNGAKLPLDHLERELPVVSDGQIPLGDLLSRVVQTIYAELSELAET